MMIASSPPTFMTNNPPPGVVMHRGLTMLELTLVIATLLTLVSILFEGSRAWKRGSDRTGCILTLRNVQVAARSYQNIYGYNCGDRPYEEHGTRDIAAHLFSKGYIGDRLYRQTRGAAKCPAGGSYSREFPDIFPRAGELYMVCSLSGPDAHAPASHGEW